MAVLEVFPSTHLLLSIFFICSPTAIVAANVKKCVSFWGRGVEVVGGMGHEGEAIKKEGQRK